MPQDLFKWEEGGGLKHHCPICQTPLSHDKCRTVCLGNHVEWCHRYHCLFRKNWSSRCSACKMTDEQHEKRHREIADLVQHIKKHKADEEAAALEILRSPTLPKTPRTPLTAKALNIVGADSSPMTDIPKMTKKERKAIKKAAKALDRDKVVTTTDIEFVAKTLHPRGEIDGDEEAAEDAIEELSEEAQIKMNLKFNNSTWNTKSARHDFILKDREELQIDDAVLDRILTELDINPNASGKEGELIAELVEAIKSDLVHFHDELRTIARNRAGFWRWANKKNYRDFVENGKEWRWEKEETVEHPAERRESETNVDADTEDDGSLSRHGSVNSSVAESSGTAITVPSRKSSNTKKKASSVLTIETPAKKKNDASGSPPPDDGWTRVGKKKLKPAVGKLTLASNGGLHHLSSAKAQRGFKSLLDVE